MRTQLIILIVLSVQSLFAQQFNRYHSFANQACKAMEDGMLEPAYILLTQAFSYDIKPKAADYLNMAKCYSQMNEPDSTEKYIRLAIARNPKIKGVVRTHNLWFEPVLGTKKWSEIKESMKVGFELTEDAERVNRELTVIDSINRQSYWRYRKIIEEDPLKSIDTVLRDVYWDSVRQMMLTTAPQLDSILLSLSVDLLTHPAVEEAFLLLHSSYPDTYWRPRREMYESLFEKGFMTPDVLSYLYQEEYFGKDNSFNYLGYSPNHFEYYDRYGVAFDYYTRSFRISNHWNYD